MFHRLGQTLLVIAVLTATGAQWSVYQSVAWSAMLARNLRTHSLSAAVQRTFNGRHPCCLCKAIAAGQKSERKHPGWVFQLKKLEFPPMSTAPLPVAPTEFRLLPPVGAHCTTINQEPPTPPPRGVPA